MVMQKTHSRGKAPCLLLAVLLFALCPLQSASAASARFEGELIAAPACTINDGDNIVVAFGNVGVTKVDGKNYLQNINYRIRCEEGSATSNMTLKVVGEATSFDRAALQTNVTDLGIRLTQNGKAFPLNDSVIVDPANLPILQAAPVKSPGSRLTEQPFEAAVTLQANYE